LAKRSAAISAPEQAAVAEESQSTPFFDQVIAEAGGMQSFEAVLTRLTGPVDPGTIPEFPTNLCLTPEQVSGIARVEADQQAHFVTCPWCKNMMAAAKPSNKEFEEIRRKSKAVTNAQHRQAASYG
jgi:hypothetical protein